ncbi:MAG: hypothetical protein V4620_08320 [Bacteroidota bacterium]
MKTVLTYLFLAAICIQANAQDDKRGYLTLGFGPSIPFSDFSSTSTGNDDAGYAMAGGNLNITFAYRLGNNLGLTAMLSGTSNPVDVDALAADFNENYPGATWTIGADRWRIGGLMVGGFATFPASENLSFDVRLLGGVLNTTMPQIRATAVSGIAGATATREEKTAAAPTFDLGFMFRYKVGGSLCLLAGADFIGANPTFNDVKTTTSFGNTSTSDIDQSYSTMNINIGIGILLK